MKQKITYAIGAYGNDVFYTAISTYLINFISTTLVDTGDAALDNMIVGILTFSIMVIRLVEIVLDPIFGNIIDRTKTKIGHFRPWILIGGITSSVLVLIMFTNLGGLIKTNPWLFVVIYILLYIIMYLFYSIKDIGFWSMLPALAFDNESREKMATFAKMGSHLGGLTVSIALMPLVLFTSLSNKQSIGDLSGWFWMGFCVCLIGCITALVVGVFSQEKQSFIRNNVTDTKGIAEIIKMLKKNDQLLWTATAYIIYECAVTLVNALGLYYFQFIIQWAQGYSLLLGVNVAISVPIIILFPFLVKRIDRKKILYAVLLTMMAGIFLFWFAGDNIVIASVAMLLFSIPQPINFLVVILIFTDCVEYGQLKLNHRDESLVLSVRPLCNKFGAAISNGVVGQTVIIAGMTSEVAVGAITASGFLAFKIVMFVIPLICIAVAALIFWKKVKLDKKMHEQIMQKLNKTWNKK